MADAERNENTGLIELTADIVSAYVAKNALSTGDLPNLIASVSKALQDLASPPPPPADVPVPAVSIRKSVTPDYLISLEDGRQYKTLKRHLSGLGMTPEDYRTKWGLPRDYPMVAAAYALKRSELAKAAGLGQMRSKSASAAAKPRRGRKAA